MKTVLNETPPGLAERVARLRWFHSIDLGNGLVTPGHKSPETLGREASRLPDVRGKTVLDIGAYDGYFSFECECRGAARVVSLDHFMWAADFEAAGRYMHDCIARGDVYRLEETEHFDLEGLPGKRAYDLAHAALGSRAEAVVCDYMKYEGAADVVLYMGVLYHMENPFEALRKVAELTKEVAVVETAAVSVPGFEHLSLWEFYGRDELEGDPTNWWAPNLKGLVEMCLAAGFRGVDVVAGPPTRKATQAARLRSLAGGLLRQAGLRPPVGPDRYRAIVHARK